MAASFAAAFAGACDEVANRGRHLQVAEIGAARAGAPRAAVTAPAAPRRPVGELLTQGWRTWDHVAIEGTSTATYRELWAHTEAGAALLDRLDPDQAGPVVGIYGPVTPRLLALVAATLLRGGGFVGLDQDWPPEWARQIVAASGISVIAVDGTALPGPLRGVAGSVVDLSQPGPGPRRPAGGPGPARAAFFPYVCFTSGTTGTPKGVLAGAAGLARMLSEAAAVPLAQAPRALHGGLLTTEPRIRELLATLAAGGQVVLADKECWTDPRQLCARLSADRITHLAAVTPSLLEALLRAHDRSREPLAIQEVHTFGEALRPDVAQEAARRWGCAVHAHYGVSESAMSATDWRSGDAAGRPGAPYLPAIRTK